MCNGLSIIFMVLTVVNSACLVSLSLYLLYNANT